MSAAGCWGWIRRHGDGRRARTRRTTALVVTPLEPRALAAVSTAQINVFPQIIPNLPGGPQVAVQVVGLLNTNSPTPPVGFYFVTDEYRADEPTGHMILFPVGQNAQKQYQYLFNFTISLQAKRSTNVNDGRHYDIFVGGTDKDGANGATVEILVPKVYKAKGAPLPVILPKPK